MDFLRPRQAYRPEDESGSSKPEKIPEGLEDVAAYLKETAAEATREANPSPETIRERDRKRKQAIEEHEATEDTQNAVQAFLVHEVSLRVDRKRRAVEAEKAFSEGSYMVAVGFMFDELKSLKAAAGALQDNDTLLAEDLQKRIAHVDSLRDQLIEFVARSKFPSQ